MEKVTFCRADFFSAIPTLLLLDGRTILRSAGKLFHRPVEFNGFVRVGRKGKRLPPPTVKSTGPRRSGRVARAGRSLDREYGDKRKTNADVHPPGIEPRCLTRGRFATAGNESARRS